MSFSIAMLNFIYIDGVIVMLFTKDNRRRPRRGENNHSSGEREHLKYYYCITTIHQRAHKEKAGVALPNV